MDSFCTPEHIANFFVTKFSKFIFGNLFSIVHKDVDCVTLILFLFITFHAVSQCEFHGI